MVYHDSFLPWLIPTCDQCTMTHSYSKPSLQKVLSTMVVASHAQLSVVSHIWMRQITHMDESFYTYGCIMSHIWMSHVTHMDESCYTYGCVMSHIWMSHVTHMDESQHTYGRVMSHIWMSHVPHIDTSCHTYGWVIAHIWMSHGTHMDESCHTWISRDESCAVDSRCESWYTLHNR